MGSIGVPPVRTGETPMLPENEIVTYKRADMPRPSKQPDRRRESTARGATVTARSTAAAARDRGWVFALAVFILTAAAFGPALNADFVDWDDTDNFLRNPNYRGLGDAQLQWMWTTFHMGHYQPLTWMTLGADYLMWGMNARGYHATSLLIHAATAAVVFLLARRLIALGAGLGVAASATAVSPAPLNIAAACAALLFSVHPLRAEAVAWVTERRDVLSGFFFVLTLLFYVRAQESPPGGYWRWIAAAGLAFLLCCFSKVIAIALPLLFLILDAYPLRRFTLARGNGADPRRTLRWLLFEKLPFVAVAAFFAWVASSGQRGMAAIIPWEMHPLEGRLGVMAFGFVYYLSKTLVPVALSPIPELHLPVQLADAKFVAAIVISGAILVGVAILAALRRGHAILAALAAYLVLYLPSSGIAQNGWQLAHDRYSYLATLSFALLIGGAIFASLRAERGTSIVVAAWAAIIALLAGLTWRQTGVWHDTASLWTHAVRVSPDSSNAQNGYGYVLMTAGRLDEAIPHFREAVRIRPGNREAHLNWWDALNRKGVDNQTLLEAYRQSVSEFPKLVDGHVNLGNALMRSADAPAAKAAYDHALALIRDGVPLSPDKIAAARARALGGLGWVAYSAQDDATAIERCREALSVDGSLEFARINLARALARSERRDEAVRELQVLLRINPNHADAKRLLEQFGNQP
ncbi:Tetratricopeptide repeat protein [Phycisphaerae bacterium RAS1]|nr:Tetratricopeptide repeat protein [Phycisphaerae bacterium RAS1]